MTSIVQTLRRVAAPVTAGALALAGAAHAALPAGVETALTDAKTDVMTVGGLVLVVVIAAAAFKLIRRAI